jgi:hypothetical protein
MSNFRTLFLAIACTASLTAPSFAMPGGEHMMDHKMSAKDMKKMKTCKAMAPAAAMKDKKCAKLMKAQPMMNHDMPMHDDKM